MEVGPGFVTPVARVRVCVETVGALALENDTKNIEKHYKGCRGNINKFIEQYTSRASLNVALQDVKENYTIENLDNLTGLILRVSFEEEIHAFVICLNDVDDTSNTIGLIQKSAKEPYILINSKLGYVFNCKNLDVDVFNMLKNEQAPFGYILCIRKKKEEPKGEEPKGEEPKGEEPKGEEPKGEEPLDKKPKKRRKVIIPKKKTLIGEATSEESTHK